MRSVVNFCKLQTRCGRYRWVLATFVVLAGLIGAATGEVVFVALAAIPCVVACFWLVVDWEWQVVMAPWVADRPQLRKPLLALNAIHWLGPLVLTFVEPGGDGHGASRPHESFQPATLIFACPRSLFTGQDVDAERAYLGDHAAIQLVWVDGNHGINSMGSGY